MRPQRIAAEYLRYDGSTKKNERMASMRPQRIAAEYPHRAQPSMDGPKSLQ